MFRQRSCLPGNSSHSILRDDVVFVVVVIDDDGHGRRVPFHELSPDGLPLHRVCAFDVYVAYFPCVDVFVPVSSFFF